MRRASWAMDRPLATKTTTAASVSGAWTEHAQLKGVKKFSIWDSWFSTQSCGMTKNEIADVLNEIGVLMELKGENPFKIRAYQSGARALEAIEEAELARLIAEEKLGTLKGFGEALVQKVTELHATGRLEFFEKLKAAVEPGLVEMLQIPGLRSQEDQGAAR